MKKIIDKIVRYAKARPFDFAIWSIILVGFLVVLYFVVILFFPFNRDQLRGNRLAGIEEVPISEERIDNMGDELTMCETVEANINGRQVIITCQTEDKWATEKYDQLADATKELFSEEELDFYDIQLIVAVFDFEEKGYTPVFGYLNRNSDSFSWTRNRSNQ